MSNSQFMNNAFVVGEVRDIELSELGQRKNARCRVNLYTNNGYVNVQLNSPKKAERNYAEDLMDSLDKGDIVQISGTLEEFFWNDEYRRNVSPYVSTKNGWGNSIKVLAPEQEVDKKANARLAGDIIEKEISYDDEGNMQIDFGLLYFSDYNPADRDNPLTREKVLLNAIENFGSYAKDNNKDIDFQKLTELKEEVELLEESDLKEIVTVYKEFVNVYNPLLFNISEFHITAKGKFAEEMEDVEEFDNITVGVYIKNNTVIDEFGLAEGSENLLEVGKFQGINESLAGGGTELESDFKTDW